MTPDSPPSAAPPSAAHPLLAHTGAQPTRVGAAFPGQRAVFRGRDLHRDLRDHHWLGLCALAVLGREVPQAQLDFFESIWVWTSYPDLRLWNNRIAALAGTTRSTANLGLSAAEAMSEATIFGRGNEYRAMDFLIKVQQRVQAGEPLAEVLTRFLADGGRLAGYGRPISTVDERMPLTLAKARELGLDQGPHLALAWAIDDHFAQQGKPLRLNLGGLVSAFAADFGWSPREFTMFLFPAFLAGMHPCYLEALELPAGARFAMRCDDVAYEGVAPRPWPPAA